MIRVCCFDVLWTHKSVWTSESVDGAEAMEFEDRPENEKTDEGEKGEYACEPNVSRVDVTDLEELECSQRHVP